MVVSIKTNTSALVALQQLNAANRDLDEIQDRVATGLKVRNAKDDAGTFAVAQKQRADLDAGPGWHCRATDPPPAPLLPSFR